MDHNWGYVAAGFTITFVTLAAVLGLALATPAAHTPVAGGRG